MNDLPTLTRKAVHAILAGDPTCPTCNGWTHDHRPTCRTCNGNGVTPDIAAAQDRATTNK